MRGRRWGQLAIKDKSPQLAAIANKGLSLARLTRLAGVADVIALLQAINSYFVYYIYIYIYIYI